MTQILIIIVYDETETGELYPFGVIILSFRAQH